MLLIERGINKYNELYYYVEKSGTFYGGDLLKELVTNVSSEEINFLETCGFKSSPHRRVSETQIKSEVYTKNLRNVIRAVENGASCSEEVYEELYAVLEKRKRNYELSYALGS